MPDKFMMVPQSLNRPWNVAKSRLFRGNEKYLFAVRFRIGQVYLCCVVPGASSCIVEHWGAHAIRRPGLRWRPITRWVQRSSDFADGKRWLAYPKQLRANLAGRRRQIHGGEPYAVSLDDNCFIDRLTNRGIKSNPSARSASGIAVSSLRAQISIDLIDVPAAQRFLAIPAAGQD